MLQSRIALALLFAFLGFVGASASASPAEPPIFSNAVSLPTEVELCAAETNRYRASVGLEPLRRSEVLEDFAMRAAQHDAAAHAAHEHFVSTNGAGVSRAETEVLWWQGFTPHSVVKHGLAVMWKVGPGGDHYDIMTGPFTEIGCGIAVKDGEITVTQDFR